MFIEIYATVFFSKYKTDYFKIVVTYFNKSQKSMPSKSPPEALENDHTYSRFTTSGLLGQFLAPVPNLMVIITAIILINQFINTSINR